MHTLQPKHFRLKKEEATKLLSKHNIALSQLPKISREDPSLPQGCDFGDVIRIEREKENSTEEYFRVVA